MTKLSGVQLHVSREMAAVRETLFTLGARKTSVSGCSILGVVLLGDLFTTTKHRDTACENQKLLSFRVQVFSVGERHRNVLNNLSCCQT